MNLTEFQGKELFKKYGIPVSKGFIVSSIEEVSQEKLNSLNSKQVVVKAQILSGGRGKAGLIKFVSKKSSEVKNVVKELLGKELNGFKVREVLIEEKTEFKKEFYLGLTVDRSQKSVLLIFSNQGGIEIEKLAKKSPEKIIAKNISKNEKIEFNVEKKLEEELIELTNKMLKLMKEKDAELVEINPLALNEKNELIAIDSKIVIDDNALYRQGEFVQQKKQELTELEKKASELGLMYVELNGEIAVIGNGAGLVMSTLDLLNHFGGKPANFLDVGGGASQQQMEKAAEIVLMKKPKALLINIFGGITRCNEIAQGIVKYKNFHEVKVPIVVRMIGTNEAEGKKILQNAGIFCENSMEEAIKKVVSLANER